MPRSLSGVSGPFPDYPDHLTMQKQSAENVTKRSRAPKANNVQIDFLISYMEDHNDFATGKLLGARGKAAHDAQWQRLIAKLNNLNGPYKTMDGLKKLWCDQRNQARARAAKGKAQQRLTGNIGKKIEVKDSDLRILSIIGGESSVGLPIMEVGVGERLEDTVDPSLVLGLKSNTTREKYMIDDDINYKERNVLTFNKENIRITDNDSIISLDSVHEDFSQPNVKCDDSFDIYTDSISSQCAKKFSIKDQQSAAASVTPFKETALMSGEQPTNFLREKLNRSHVQENSDSKTQSDTESFDEATNQFIDSRIPVKEVSKRLAPKSILDGCNSKYLRNSFSEKTVNPNIQRNFLEPNDQSDSVVLPSQFDDPLRQSKETLKRLTRSNRLNSKCSRNSSLEETINFLQNTQDKQNKSSEAMVENLHRIASAVEQQNNLVEKSLALHKQTLQILAATVKDLTGKM